MTLETRTIPNETQANRINQTPCAEAGGHHHQSDGKKGTKGLQLSFNYNTQPGGLTIQLLHQLRVTHLHGFYSLGSTQARKGIQTSPSSLLLDIQLGLAISISPSTGSRQSLKNSASLSCRRNQTPRLLTGTANRSYLLDLKISYPS